jgi:glycosyltransferase involved in cell wall biosynthesis
MQIRRREQRAGRELGSNESHSFLQRAALTKRILGFLISLVDEALAFVKAGFRFNADVYVSNDLDTLLPAFLCSQMQDRKLVYDAHELWTDQFIGSDHWIDGYPAWLLSLLNDMEQRLIKYCDATLTVNEFIAREMENRYGARPNVILNLPKLNEHLEPHAPNKIKTVLYQGAYGPGRGLENVLHACHYLHHDVRISLRGYGAFESKLRQIAKSEKISNCRFEQPVAQDDAIAAASSADVGVVPYLPLNLNNYYTSPNKLFDYIQAGLAVVASDVPYLREIITKYHIGYVFDPTDIKSMAQAINMATRPATLKRLRKNVLNIRPLFCWENEEEKYLAIFKGLSL